MMARLMALIGIGVLASSANTLWYNGDSNTPAVTSNSVEDPFGDNWVYDDFIVPGADGAWQITSVFSNNYIYYNLPTQARWEIRTNLSTGVAGQLIAGGVAPAVVTPTGRTSFPWTEYTVSVDVSVTLFPGHYWLAVTPVNTGPHPFGSDNASISNSDRANCVGNPCGNNGNSFSYSELVPSDQFIPAGFDFCMGVLGSKNGNPSDAPIIAIGFPSNWSVVSQPTDFSGWAINNPSSSHYSPIASVKVFRDGSFVGNATYGTFIGNDCENHYSPACPDTGFDFPIDLSTFSGGLHTLRALATDSDPSPDSGYAEATYLFAGTTGSNDNAHPGLVVQNPIGSPFTGVDPGASQVWFLGGPQGTAVIGGADLKTATNPWRVAGIADFDGDGHPDVLWQDPASGANQLWFLGGTSGATLIGTAALSSGSTWRIVAVADFDGDSHPDLVWQDPATGASQVWFMNGAQGTTYSGSASLSGPNSWQIVGAADFDGNGHADLVWQDPATGMTQVWFMGGTQGTTIIGSAPLSLPNAWRIGRVMDFDGDGHPDLVWQDPVTGTSQAWLFGGTQGTTLTAAVALTGPTPLLISR
jgi:hypothetical protein